MKQISISNIENLTSIWKKVSIPHKGYFSENEFDYSLVPDSDWPNRLWFKQPLDEHALHKARAIIEASPIKMAVPYWGDFSSPTHELFDKMGFVVKTQQTGMSLQLTKHFDRQDRLHLLPVKGAEEAKMWSQIHSQSFGYVIRHDILLLPDTGIEYFLVYWQDQIVGTVLTLQSQNVIGIHGLGVISEMRKKGIAEEVMAIVLNNAVEQKIAYATLQASPLGKGIYQRMGFTEDFVMTNYIL